MRMPPGLSSAAPLGTKALLSEALETLFKTAVPPNQRELGKDVAVGEVRRTRRTALTAQM